MTLILLAFLGGALTIVSPCILPVLPFVFARADQPFVRAGLPMLVGMALTFALVATLAAVAGGWAVAANQYGRFAALALLALFGLTLLFPEMADRLARPVVALGDRLSRASEGGSARPVTTVASSLMLGVATGLLWAPCAGPILGLILTGAALKGASAGTTLLLFSYALGAATSLGLALLAGGRVFTAMKRSLAASEWVRRGLGAAVVAAVIAIALGLDTGFLTNVSLASTASLEQGLVDKLRPADGKAKSSVLIDGGSGKMMSGGGMKAGDGMMASGEMTAGEGMKADAGAMMSGAMAMAKTKPANKADDLPIEGAAPSLAGATEWLNSPPLTAEALKGKVVVVDFWTYSCINCLRAIPYVRAWAEKYKDQGLVVIGVHAPEFAFERNIGNVKKAVEELKIGYPVAIDNDYAIWRAFDNQYWPAHYFIDAEGRIRHHHFGEGDYEGSERVIQQLLAEAGMTGAAPGMVRVSASGVEAPSNEREVRSPETYIGYDRAERFVSPGGAIDGERHDYAIGAPRLNEWALSGNWTIDKDKAVLDEQDGAIAYRFHARDLHLVLGPGLGGKPVRFRVTVDGVAPGENHGADVDSEGQGVVSEERLYQLIRQDGDIADRTFEIKFLDPGVKAYAFTFG
jgi:cytochrome c biogenesis protein CcdA/thiol-disulfide isomerase/thioredoxin